METANEKEERKTLHETFNGETFIIRKQVQNIGYIRSEECFHLILTLLPLSLNTFI